MGMDLYGLSADWCKESARGLKLKYVAQIEGGEKYFYSKEEAQNYFNSSIPKPFTQAVLSYSNGEEFVNVAVKYQ